jgi:hypothetical protein
MESYYIFDDDVLHAPFATIKGLCFYAFFSAYCKWLTEDQTQVPETEQNQIEEFFAETLSFLVNIRNDENDQTNFNLFTTRLNTIIELVNGLKE